MRWERLFTDLEGQLEAVATDQLDADVADRTRRELAATTFEGRLRGAVGRVLELSVAGLGPLAGEVRRVGPGWLMVDVVGGSPAVVSARFVTGARDLPMATREELGAATANAAPGLVPVLRVLSRDRTVTAVVLATGATYTGTVDRVGTDYFDLAEHSLDEPRRASVIRGVRTIPTSAVAALRPRLE